MAVIILDQNSLLLKFFLYIESMSLIELMLRALLLRFMVEDLLVELLGLVF